MRTIPPALQARLDSGVTTLCRCWIVTRRDGTVQGFTDHDEDVPMGSTTCRAGTGLTGSEISQKHGLAVDSSELSGALSDDALNEDDLAAGLYDAAAVALWLVDWSEPSLKVLIASGTLGEVRRDGTAFVAEVRGLSQALGEESGRLYTSRCGADLGDGRCRVDLTSPTYQGRWQRDYRYSDVEFHGERSRRVCRWMVHGGQTHIHRRRQCRPVDGGEGASQS